MVKYAFTIFLALSYELDAENLSRSVVFDYALNRPFDNNDSTMALDLERQVCIYPGHFLTARRRLFMKRP